MADVKLEVNENEVPLNDLMEEMLENLIFGYLKSAKGIPKDIKTIGIEIKL
ncbi:MAG: hypothetical protein GF317_08285 [Candidatus Lokiarchaeota archaeon]|nr:hypothetical protein [Candidatus Lokiarchaeota archaeon]MBD3199709.1 hypothetical protein [Candidatus Lokiarchaeota archaeon]